MAILVRSYQRRSVKGRNIMVAASQRASKSSISGQVRLPSGKTYGKLQSAKLMTKAGALRRKLGMITSRGKLLSKPQRKAFYKASTIEAQHKIYGGHKLQPLRKSR